MGVIIFKLFNWKKEKRARRKWSEIECTTASQLQSLAIFWIADKISSLQGLQKCCREILFWNAHGNLYGKCREISGEVLLFLFPQEIIRGFAKGWFPKGWFWRMFPRNENRNEGTFAKTTLLETALVSPNNPFLVLTKGWFPKGWFRRMFPQNKNWNEGTFAKTTLLWNRPFISQWNEAQKSPEAFTSNFTPFFTRRFSAANAQFHGFFTLQTFVGVATPAEPRGEKRTLFFCANFGRWKTFKISWKVPVNYF